MTPNQERNQQRKLQEAYEKMVEQRLDLMRKQVQETELQARYWEAQWKVKHFTLADQEITPTYNEYIAKATAEAQEQAQIEQDLQPELATESPE